MVRLQKSLRTKSTVLEHNGFPHPSPSPKNGERESGWFLVGSTMRTRPSDAEAAPTRNFPYSVPQFHVELASKIPLFFNAHFITTPRPILIIHSQAHPKTKLTPQSSQLNPPTHQKLLSPPNSNNKTDV